MSMKMAASTYEENILDEIAAKEPKEQPLLRALLDAPTVFSQPWKQTSTIDPPQIEDENLRTRLGKVLIAHYREVRLDPYNPEVWIDRGRHFMELGYGELAVSDAYKARLLLDSFLGVFDTSVLSSELDMNSLPHKVSAALAGIARQPDTAAAREHKAGEVSRAKLLQHEAFQVMVSALICVRAYHDAIQVLDQAIVLCGSSEQLQDLCTQVKEKSRFMEQWLRARDQSLQYIQQSMKQGFVDRVAYPWINPDELQRGNKAMKKVKRKFETSSANATLGLSSVGGIISDNYGVFARQDISQDTLIVTDRSALTILEFQGKENCWACSEPLGQNSISVSCCKAIFCSELCKTEANNTYHRVLCGKDFGWLYEASKDANELTNDMVPLLLMKILATAVQQNARPLKVACVGPLKTGYEKQTSSIFKLHDNVIAPVKILQTLGVDVFKDMRFDSWALQTLILRIENNKDENKEGEVMFTAIHPLFCMFNHDCDPSARWTGYHQGGPVSVVARRDIKEGEEISVTYINEMPLEEDRRPRLMAQIGTVCGCARCYGDRKAAFAEAPKLMQMLNDISNESADPETKTLRRLRDRLFVE